ncbi:PilC/PilY family type IV pilus protein [Paucibacter sp. PLA-PC-4]|uniref:pilus assembly protein n=1 Tax=Paucibacter sp. PLA-PC-4 TaxID=2993655 RepID=UPI0022487A77|nr:PilC/PilY family type IV pilus protein [Paucibacter sp. PLA-PC-4]MCX2861375.1 PilC/PilY family type IV pilus protein [Paucibacter sp. PLA-PC-4]
MKTKPISAPARRYCTGLLLLSLLNSSWAQIQLADQPVFSSVSVPGNMALALSVEFPTAISVAHKGATYSSANVYLGYFDPNKCYDYTYKFDDTTKVDSSYFSPVSLATSRTCSGQWSGNYMNWATMQTIDPFRWALTGGYRSTDTKNETILEKGWASAQGGIGNFPDRAISPAANIPKATPVNWTTFNTKTYGLGNVMRFTASGNLAGTSPTPYGSTKTLDPAKVYQLMVRVKVCDPALGVENMEKNCTKYSDGNYKPTGLIQKYSDQIRYSAFGYLNDGDLKRDGAVLRAAQKFVGPTRPVPGGQPLANANPEWNAENGVMNHNPDAADAAATQDETKVTVSNSGVMNYLNQFGQFNKSYKTYDPVSELHYAALRYFMNLGNVPAWSSMGSAGETTKKAWVDGFPVITNWVEPMLYSCQKNFILGIGDTNSHADRNLPGASGASEPKQPGEVTDDKMFNAVTATNKVGELQNSNKSLGTQQNIANNNAGALMAGMAYYANTKDIRPDESKWPGRQAVQTYWLDVLETGFKNQNTNPFYLATKFGGFTVPEGFDPDARTTALPETWWRTNTDTVGTNVPRPDNYFTADRPDLMVDGLTKAFASIASKLKANTTTLQTAMPQVTTSGSASFAALFDATTWSGELVASKSTFDETSGAPVQTESWRFSAKLGNQAKGTGWDGGRVIITHDGTKGVPFRWTNLAAGQKSALDTAYRSGDDSGDFVNYLRGERQYEISVATDTNKKFYRDRSSLVGDIVNSRVRVVVEPNERYSDATNPGYNDFKKAYAKRKPMVYVGTNAGMLHGVDASSTTTAGNEVFAYVPGALYDGPNKTPAVNGLQALGKPEFTHYNYVDGSPVVADVDLARTGGDKGTENWRTLLIGSLGKGGKSIFALDVTNPAGMIDGTNPEMSTEPNAATKVLWEFKDDTSLGYTYGEPALVKTRKHGWVVIFGSGYNNEDGKGYLFVLNAKTGAKIAKIPTSGGKVEGDKATPLGLAHVQAYIPDLTDNTVETVYAGDLHGQVWRFDLTDKDGNFPPGQYFALLEDSAGKPLPITSRPLVVIQPKTNRRYVTVGTGRLLHSTDSGNTQGQRFYAIIDGVGVRHNKPEDLPAGISFPIGNAKLRQLTDLTQEIVLDLKSEIGWYVDLGRLGAGAGWRVISDPASFNGIVAFAAMVPSSADACAPSGSSRVYAIDLGRGQSTFEPNNKTFIDLAGVVTDLRFYSVSGKPRLLAGTDTGKISPLPGKYSGSTGLRRLNWRQIKE